MTLPTSQEHLVPSDPLGEQEGQERHITESVTVSNRPPAHTSPTNVARGYEEEILSFLKIPATDHSSSYFDAFMK